MGFKSIFKDVDRSDLSLFKNRLWKLMQEKEIDSAPKLAKELHENHLIEIKHRKNFAENGGDETSVKSIERRVQEHLNSDTPDKLQANYTIAYCKYFGCSADYLFGFIDLKTHANTDISKETGLSDTAINNLKCDKEETKLYNVSHYHHIDILNFLLCDKDGAFLLSSIYDYLFGNYVKTSTGNDTMILLDDTGMPCNGAELFIKDINAYFLASITEKLSQIKGDISKNPNSKHYGKYNPKTATERQELWKDISPLKK